MHKIKYDLRIYKNTLRTNHSWKNGIEYKEDIPGYYSNELLSTIINDTYDVIKEIVENRETDEYVITLNGDRPIEHICLDSSECVSSDIVYIDKNGRLISKIIIQDAFFVGTRILKSQTKLALVERCPRERFYELKLSNLPENLEDLKEDLFGTTKKLK